MVQDKGLAIVGVCANTCTGLHRMETSSDCSNAACITAVEMGNHLLEPASAKLADCRPHERDGLSMLASRTPLLLTSRRPLPSGCGGLESLDTERQLYAYLSLF